MPEKGNMSTVISKPAPISDHANLYVTEVQITAMVATTSLPNPLQFDGILICRLIQPPAVWIWWPGLPFFSLSLLLEVALRFLRLFFSLWKKTNAEINFHWKKSQLRKVALALVDVCHTTTLVPFRLLVILWVD